MTKLLPPVRNGSLRQKTIQQLQIMAIVFVIVLFGLKIYIHMFPGSLLDEMTTCKKCTLHSYPSVDDSIFTDGTYDDIQPAVHPLPNSSTKYDFTLVTGASMNHFCPIKSFLYHMKNTLEGLNARVIVYDLGFSEPQIEVLRKLQELGYITELRTFQWSHYPSFWNISVSRGEYAWKPGMIAEVARDYPGKVVWLDSGTLVERSYFVRLNSLLKKFKGFISPRSTGTMETWTHPGVYEYYDDDHTLYDNIINCNGASVTFDTRKTQYIIDEWFKCALVKDCIAPPGSSRINHRQDQAILTYIAAKNNLQCNEKKLKLGIHVHEDGHCRSFNTEFESTNGYSEFEVAEEAEDEITI